MTFEIAEQYRVLLVEDDPTTLSQYTRLFESNQFDVVAATDLATARGVLARTFDVVVLDLFLPDGNGLDLMPEIRAQEHLRYLPVICVTGVETGAQIREAFDAGVADLMVKPVRPDLLLEKARALSRYNRLRLDHDALEQQVDSSSERLHRVLQLTRVALLGWEYGQIVVADGIDNVLGYSAAEIMAHSGRLSGVYMHPDDVELHTRMVRGLIDGKNNSGEPYATRMRHVDGSWRHIQHRNFISARDASGKVLMMEALLIDVTEETRQSEALERVLDSMGVVLIRGDVQAGIIFIKNGLENILGDNWVGRRSMTVEERIAMTHPDDEKKAHQLRASIVAGDSLTTMTRMRHSDGHWVWVEAVTRVTEWDQDGRPLRMDGYYVDATDRLRRERELEYQATHDALTGLINRAEFERRVARVLTAAERDQQQGEQHALIYIDLDDFKIVNDTCGHQAGDKLLQGLSAMLVSDVRQRDTFARLGGDEFGLLLEHCDADHAMRVADNLLGTVAEYEFNWGEHRFRISASIGVVVIETSHTLETVFQQADEACYAAKEGGRNRVQVYVPDDEALSRIKGQMQWVSRIHGALAEDRFELMFQPIVSAASTQTHLEVLVRMRSTDGSTVPPGVFLPAAERFHVAYLVDRWVVDSVFRLIENTPTLFDRVGHLSVNLSGQTLNDSGFLSYLDERLRGASFAAHRLCFEVTETAAIYNLAKAREFLTRVKQHGCSVALDDFGSGASSFAYLKNFPVDYLKIDGAFVRDIVSDRIDYVMVKSMAEIGRELGLQTIAEFVENDEIRALLEEIGIDFYQGYGIGKPAPIDHWLDSLPSV